MQYALSLASFLPLSLLQATTSLRVFLTFDRFTLWMAMALLLGTKCLRNMGLYSLICAYRAPTVLVLV